MKAAIIYLHSTRLWQTPNPKRYQLPTKITTKLTSSRVVHGRKVKFPN